VPDGKATSRPFHREAAGVWKVYTIRDVEVRDLVIAAAGGHARPAMLAKLIFEYLSEIDQLGDGAMRQLQ
jgi:hypothetical protein